MRNRGALSSYLFARNPGYSASNYLPSSSIFPQTGNSDGTIKPPLALPISDSEKKEDIELANKPKLVINVPVKKKNIFGLEFMENAIPRN